MHVNLRSSCTHAIMLCSLSLQYDPLLLHGVIICVVLQILSNTISYLLWSIDGMIFLGTLEIENK